MIKNKISDITRKFASALTKWADSLEEELPEEELQKSEESIIPELSEIAEQETEQSSEEAAANTADSNDIEIYTDEEKPENEKETPKSEELEECSLEQKDELADFHISQDPRVEEERRRNKEAEKLEKEERRKKRKKALFLIPVAAIVVLIISTVPSFIKAKQAYSLGESLLEAEDFESAEQVFADLGNYADSQEKVLFEIPYRKAIIVLNSARNNDDSGLELAGIEKSAVSEEESAQILLYRKAVEMFSALSGYSDSDKKIAVANAGIDEYYEEKNLKAYNDARDLLDKKMYLPAMEAFEELGQYRDCEDLVKECIYRRAKELLKYAENNNVRGISICLSHDSAVQSRISIPKSLLVEQGGDAVALIELKDTCGHRCTDLIYEDIPGKEFLPFCDAVAAEFSSISEYEDSIELRQRAKEAGDFTGEFFDLCRSGYLSRALDWLNKYDDEFESRETYTMLLNLFLPYCRLWQLNRGDSSLIPFTAGEEGTCDGFISAVSVTDTEVSLKLAPVNSDYSVELIYVPEASGFRMFSEDTSTYTFALINANGTFTIARYNEMGFTLSSCEYNPV